MYAVVFHAHQKIDKIARKKLQKSVGSTLSFPSIATILQFEGGTGPDSSKLKNAPNIEQPWHFINPHDHEDVSLSHTISNHYQRLVLALKQEDIVRAGFEAAWLAHALVDGLTPAHHYPYEEMLTLIRGDADRNTRTSMVKRLTVQGETTYASVAKSLRLVGPKGLLTTHTSFEAGAYVLLKSQRRSRRLPLNHAEAVATIERLGVAEYFLLQARQVADWHLYDAFLQLGWTLSLARKVNRRLLPLMIDTVAVVWQAAVQEAAKK